MPPDLPAGPETDDRGILYSIMMGTRTRTLLGGAALSLVLAACGGGDGADTPTTEPAASVTTTTTAPSETTTTMAGDQGGGPDLAGTSWTVTHHASELYPDVTNVWPDTEITLELSTDGTISGNAGCNDYSGAYELSGPYVTEPDTDEQRGQAMTISGLSWTEMACESENVMEQEAEFLQALQRVEYWSIGTGFGGDNDLLLVSLEDGLMVEAASE